MVMPPEEFERFKKSGFDFIWEELSPLEEQIERTQHIPREELWPRFRDHGFLGMTIPKEYGGQGLSESQYIEFEKEWAKVHGGIRGILHVHNVGGHLISLAGREEQKREYLPRIANGELSVAFALTERYAGTGRDIKTTARREGDHFILNGEKHLITNADFAQLFNVVCYTSPELGERGISNLLVPRETPGFTIEDTPPTMGCTGMHHGRLTFKDCVLPAENMLGNEGEGLEKALAYLDLSRLHIAATALGICERCLELALDYAKKRVTFGKPIAAREGIRGCLAEMATDIYALQKIISDAARKADEGKNISIHANMCKLFAIEAERRVTDNALLVFGGRGYTREYSIERLYRDSRLNWLEEATPSIHKLVIARNLLQRTFEFHKIEF